ncbi:TIGR00341 family protein [Halomicrococcus sp. SG-WS-1]|uniref:TIGR00341 family protein n=1 Tax=Halomicrococcus sp. SG-WS-1 TaxID=3439057 RepID=UPI003F79AD36
MRHVEVTIPAGERETVVETLEKMEIDYYLTDATSGPAGDRKHTAVATFPLPQGAVQPVIDELHSSGLSEDAHVVIIDAEVDTSRRFQELTERFETDSSITRIAREEILIRARELSPRFWTFITMTIISSVVAAAGLLLDSPAVVVGSMVIAPLVGPALSTGVGTVLDEDDLFRRGVKLQAIGGVVSILSATVFAFAVRRLYLFPPNTDIATIGQISGRLTPDFLSLIVALGAGVAGVFSLATGVSVALVGVMIAAALIPPAAAVGIGIAWLNPSVALSSGVLVLVNVLSINLAAILTLRYMGYQPKSWFKMERSRREMVKRIGVLVLAISLLSVFLGAVTYSTYQDAQFEHNADDTVGDTLGEAPYEDVQKIGIEVNYRQGSMFGNGMLPTSTLFHEPDRVIVTVGVPSDGRYPRLADRIERNIERRTDADVTVELRYIETDRAS